MATILRRRGHSDEDTPLLGELTSAADLDGPRLRALEGLRLRSAEQFDPSSPEDMGFLKKLWATSFPGQPFELPSEEWKQLGFQGRDPRSDLRGCGVMGLRQLCTTLLAHRAALDEVFVGAQQSALSDFPLSIASINTTGMLLSHLHLAPKLALSFLRQRTEASHATLHGFLSLGFESEGYFSRYDEDANLGEEQARVARLERALDVMHAQLLLGLAREWREMLDANPSTTIMDFPIALRAVHSRMCGTLRSLQGAPWALRHVESSLAKSQASMAEEDTPPAWAALSLLLGLVMGLCQCTGRKIGTFDDDAPLAHPGSVSYTKDDKNR
mmetsp:Transcript_9315/g.19029  ORF Transcript_9315/g.19029 Transcript_9315/m.19029 type:complete len:328 (-) Transcript_9315:208-1191(-)|eukprot:CAMPEP_0174720346 /NCGR_PEP_ID=MMETSP1094-20130205/33355_1 /TAXON_ID=156173 /ORGANISM="Chrysochromulina brevifilum, Strain UTEX LB 985" /LENGTH=327 /DNA_ID=CAMNT_0015920813 /DNA_START=146 /DNA_END=1129 /DNA_ORIENTATION=+